MATPVNKSDVSAQAAVSYLNNMTAKTQAGAAGNGAVAPVSPTGGTPVNQTNAESQIQVSDLNALNAEG